jgi:hypothetical protein
MCIVSMIYDYHRDRFPEPEWWTIPKYDHFKELLKKGEEYDEKTDQKDCHDPEKAKFLKVIEDYLKEKYGIDVTVTEKNRPSKEPPKPVFLQEDAIPEQKCI